MAQERDGLLPPLYQQVAADLHAQISDGQYPVGTRLPTKPQLMERFDVSLGTLDKAIDVLRKAGLVETRQGSGMYVREPPPEERTEYDAVRDQVAELQREVAELREQVNGHAELAARVGRIEANLTALYGQLGREYPRGGRRERAKAAAGGGR
jgi:DNA-binding GntR family transcriptional regulator